VTTRWRPLWSGDEAREAWRVIDGIAATLAAAPDPALADPTVSGGCAGMALFFAQLDVAQPGRGHDATATRLLDAAFEGVAAQPLGPQLYQGFTGVAWAGELLTGEAQDALDEPLLDLLAGKPWPGDYDLIVGLAGLAVWALDAVPRPASEDALARIVEHLCELSQETPHGRRFWTAPALLPAHQLAVYPRGYENFGAAHGQPAALAALAEAVAAGTLPPELHSRARRTAAELGAHLLHHAGRGTGVSRWPAMSDSDEPPGDCRLAWCYGDLGVAAALAVAGEAASEAGMAEGEAWLTEAHATALHAARRDPVGAGVRDAGVCHGAAGNALLFMRLHQRFGDAVLADAARHWLRAVLEFEQPGAGVAGFLAWRPDGSTAEWGFLEGATGIAQTLLAAVSEVSPVADRLLYATRSPRR
jgi:hypothetical protein